MERVKKSSKIILPICLILAMLVAIFSFAGCGTDIGTLSENIEKMNSTLSSYSSFMVKNEERLNSRDYYSISYGSVVDGYVTSEEENYSELYDYYNSIFSLSMSYFDGNISVITNLTDEEMNDETRNALNELNQTIVDFNNEIEPFVRARNELVVYFNEYNEESEVAKLSQLRGFKREYAVFVDKAVQISLSLSNAVKATGDLEDTANVALTKNSICNQLLPIYHEFLVMNIGTFNWAESPETEIKTRINNVISTLENNLSSYISLFQTNTNLKELTQEELNAVELDAENFFTEMNDYLASIEGLDLQNLAVNNYNNLEDYLNVNNKAEIYIQKIEQFVNISLPTYIASLSESVVA